MDVRRSVADNTPSGGGSGSDAEVFQAGREWMGLAGQRGQGGGDGLQVGLDVCGSGRAGLVGVQRCAAPIPRTSTIRCDRRPPEAMLGLLGRLRGGKPLISWMAWRCDQQTDRRVPRMAKRAAMAAQG
jgi:hypothetical protein